MEGILRIGKGVFVATVLVLLAGGRSSLAATIGGARFPITYWAGTGSNHAALVIDFGATGGGSYSFGYRFDGAATGYDMIQAVAAAGDLDYQASSFPGFGTFIDNFSRGGEAGNADFYWQYFNGTASGGIVTWVSAWEGMSTRILADGSIDGWYNGFDGHVPRIPEPATGLLVAAAALLVPAARRRSRRSRAEAGG
ncbi:MAG TPA: hypothetical protein VLM89_11595 [Phycisphaerae bacterium]|nr:hypothetical protein [Phycisphaerae bacterium]